MVLVVLVALVVVTVAMLTMMMGVVITMPKICIARAFRFLV